MEEVGVPLPHPLTGLDGSKNHPELELLLFHLR